MSKRRAGNEWEMFKENLIEAIEEYNRDDPLLPWLECIKWVQESFHCSGLVVKYEQCVQTFWHSERYKDDLRYLKVWLECYRRNPLALPFCRSLSSCSAADPKLFMKTLEELHKSMKTTFMNPIIGGNKLDLHRLFLEVTSRGGIEKVTRDKVWTEITAGFQSQSTARIASYMLEHYYGSLLYHYEQIFYFKALGWKPSDVKQIPLPEPVPAPNVQQLLHPHVSASQLPEGTAVSGIIDGKFEGGFLATFTVGSEELKGVLYQAPENLVLPTMPQQRSVPVENSNTSTTALGVHRHRHKKCEIKKKDPGHPKQNQSGYSFFFAEQHARLEPLHHGNNIEISKIVEEHWNKLMEPEKAVYQEKALEDEERHRAEMENYREKLKTGQGIGDAVPLQEQIPNKDMVDAHLKVDETEGAESPQAIVIEKRDPGHPKPNQRKKCEIKKKDPGHPKQNQSGYSFFFAEQHARLEPLHHGNNIEISKIVEEHWNKLMEPEKAVYQEKALEDEGRHRAEMENYREKLKTDQGIGDAVLSQEQIPNNDMVDADLKVDETEGAESPQAIVIGQP
ncbi:hypothetical protein K1719_026232 [Acacia pycnantha]|nr:hypothetical protein K1719_026232 [Acacia pycnantha]